MPNSTLAFQEKELAVARERVIQIIFHMNHGYRRGLNHDVYDVGPEIEDLVACLLRFDKQFRKRSHKLALKGRDLEWLRRRKDITTRTVEDLWDSECLFNLSGCWTLRVTFTESFREGQRKHKRATKHDDRSYHGNPKRDRKRNMRHLAP